jgi:site-specific DNA-cytosine methylase
MICVDLYCGLGGWAEGFLAEGWRVVGFDIERHRYPDGGGYPGQLILQDVLTVTGRQIAVPGLACIVASPPCQEYSYHGDAVEACEGDCRCAARRRCVP